MFRISVAGLVIAVAGASAQHAGIMPPVRSMPAPVNANPYGNILFPGGLSTTHAMRLGGTISGSSPYTGAAPGGPGVGHGRNRTVVVPYAVPVWYGGYGGYGGYYGYGAQPQQPNMTVVVPQQPTPSVIINQHYNTPDGIKPTVTAENSDDGLKVYEAPSRRSEAAPEAGATPAAKPAGTYVRDEKPNIYLIAMKDATVREAIGYWVAGDALHYVTPEARISQVNLALVDREGSAALNAQRKLEFELPR